jgi:uncharacterized peroxidase-related enzyme
MSYLPTNQLPFIEEDEATGQVAQLYEEFKRDLHLPAVPNILKALGSSPETLTVFGKLWVNAEEYRTLPEALTAMIAYTIATKSDCTYCSASFELTCRSLGVDEDTLDKLIKDLANLNPERVRAIIDFALKVAKHPQELSREDFDKVRQQGVSEGEIVEIIFNAAYSVLLDIVADALQIDVDSMITMALEEMR